MRSTSSGTPWALKKRPFRPRSTNSRRPPPSPTSVRHSSSLVSTDSGPASPIARAADRRHERAAVLEEFQRRREGYTEAVKEVLAQANETSGPYQHVRGVVAELLQVDLEMAPLIEVTLGKHPQHIVVTTLDEAVAAMQKELQRFPNQVTFTPINAHQHRTAQVREIDLHGQPGIIGRGDLF